MRAGPTYNSYVTPEQVYSTIPRFGHQPQDLKFWIAALSKINFDNCKIA